MVTSTRPLSEQTWAGNVLLVRTTTPTPGSGDVLSYRPGIDSALSPLIATQMTEYSPIASHDGKWIAWVSNETGRFEVYAASFANPAAGKWPISTAGGNNPRWSYRGDEIFYLDDRSNLVAVRISTLPTFAVQSARILFNASEFTQLAVSRRNYDVAVDDQRFLMVRRGGGARSEQLRTRLSRLRARPTV